MNWGVFVLLAALASIAFLFVQRTEAKRRRIALVLMISVGLLAFYWASVRALSRELVGALVAGLLINLLFWLLIGRYNPVKDSDDVIQVIGMDD